MAACWKDFRQRACYSENRLVRLDFHTPLLLKTPDF